MKIPHQLSMAATLSAFVLPAWAEAVPQGLPRDSRTQTAEYHPDQVYRIHSQIGRAVMVQLEDGERLSGDAAALGDADADAWKVAVRGNNIIFKPQAPRPKSNMLINSNKRTYAFSLTMGSGKTKQAATYILRFNYPDSIQRQNTLVAEKQAQAMSALCQAGRGAEMRNTDYWGYGHRALAPTVALPICDSITAKPCRWCTRSCPRP